MAVLELAHDSPRVLPPLIGLLFLIGCGISAAQSMSAVVLFESRAGGSGVALGVHNMGRFTGLALGYAWVAGAYAVGMPAVVHSGTMLAAGVALIATGWTVVRRDRPV